MAEVERRLGPVDVLVNNAGVERAARAVRHADPEAWWRCLEVNLRGPALCARAVLPGMLARARADRQRHRAARATGPTAPGGLRRQQGGADAPDRGPGGGDAGAGRRRLRPQPGAGADGAGRGAAQQADAPEIAQVFRQWFADGVDIPAERSAALLVQLAGGRADALSGRYLSSGDDSPGTTSAPWWRGARRSPATGCTPSACAPDHGRTRPPACAINRTITDTCGLASPTQQIAPTVACRGRSARTAGACHGSGRRPTLDGTAGASRGLRCRPGRGPGAPGRTGSVRAGRRRRR